MPEIVDIEEEASKYEDEWVVFEVTEFSEIGIPAKGRLLCHGKNRDDIDREEMKAGDKHTYLFFTGEPAPANVIVVL